LDASLYIFYLIFICHTHTCTFIISLMKCIIICYIQKNTLEWRTERFLFIRSFSLLQAMISKRRSSPMIRLGIRARPSSLVRSISFSLFSQLVNQLLLQSSFHKDPIPLKDFTEGPPNPIDGHWRSNSYNNNFGDGKDIVTGMIHR
jgi:hypothetical protein